MANPMSFIFGGNTGIPTADALKKRRDMADLLAMRGATNQPRNLGEGLASIGQALAYRFADKRLGKQEDSERSKIAEAIAGLGGGYGGYSGGPIGGAPTGFTGAGGAPSASAVAPQAPSGGLTNFRDAIASIESAGSGDYAAVGPVTKSGDRAYGRYQVMGANIPEWTRAALGQEMTPEQFLASEEAQNATFDHRFGSYASKYGPEGAARAWFSGEGGMNNPNASDGYNTNDQYAAKFNGALGGGGFDMNALAGMMPREPDMGRISQIAEILSNPYADDGQKMVLQALLKREMDGGGIDPLEMARLGLDAQRLQLDRDKFAQGTREGPKFYGNAQWAQDPETGELRPYQIGTDGSVNWLDLDGATPLPPTRNVDLGTTQAQVTSAGGQQINALDKDVRGAAAEKIAGDTQGAAAAGLPEFEMQVGEATALIDGILENPALGRATGVLQSRLPTVRQDTANVEADINQLRNQIFPMAIQALRGLGAMSEMEARSISDSIAALDPTRDDAAFKNELNRIKGVLDEKLAIARQKAGVAAPAAPGGIPQAAAAAGIDPDLWQYMSPEDQALWQN